MFQRVLVVVVAAISFSAFSNVAHAGARSEHKIGLFAGIITEPFPSMYGFNAGYNILDFLRASAGIGFLNYTDPSYTLDVTTLNLDVKAFIPEIAFSPFVMIGVSKVSLVVAGTDPDLSALGGFGASGSSVVFGGGIDWQTHVGFNIGVSYKYVTIGEGGGLPGLYVGWYF